VDGGYAEVMIAEARGIASIPDELSSTEAAPLLCAGITTYIASVGHYRSPTHSTRDGEIGRSL
jgi:D-arabinose 1-dehydrogenase-like Zn-dependent alcohol dehydrogenase